MITINNKIIKYQYPAHGIINRSNYIEQPVSIQLHTPEQRKVYVNEWKKLGNYLQGKYEGLQKKYDFLIKNYPAMGKTSHYNLFKDYEEELSKTGSLLNLAEEKYKEWKKWDDEDKEILKAEEELPWWKMPKNYGEKYNTKEEERIMYNRLFRKTKRPDSSYYYDVEL